MKIVIRAGGIGTRLWPMSRINNPKQFQKIIGEKTMVRTTYERVAPLLKSPDDLFLSVNKNFTKIAKQDIPEVKKKNIIIETDTRNTGPAMCLEVCYLKKFCQPNEIIASLPSDDYVSDSQAFRDLLLMTEEFILEKPNYILTPAIRPNYPDTGYTYFKAGENLQQSGEEAIYEVAQIVEKPNSDYCQELIKAGIYYCHTGMYLWQLGHIEKLFRKWQPTMYKICCQVVDLIIQNKDWEKAKELYSQLEKITIETAITEKCDKIAMSVSNRIGWSDLGKWHVIKRILQRERKKNLVKGEVMINEAKNNLIYSNVDKKIIVVNAINDLAIVDTDDVLFISSLKDSAEVKKIVEKLKEEGKEKYL
jgi:mannose-1-phosphate guanylyltransferase